MKETRTKKEQSIELLNASELMADSDVKKQKKGKTVLAKIFGFEILSDTVYTVRDRPDPSAPEAYIKEGVSKCPSIPDNGLEIECRYDVAKKLYDTGLYANSFSLLEFTDEEKKIEIDRRRKNLFDPVSKLANSPLNESDFEYWSNHKITVTKETAFVTSDILSAFDLYIALSSGLLSPYRDFHHSYKFAMYYIEGASGKYDFKAESESRKVDAISEFAIMLRENREKIMDVLFRLRVVNAADPNEDTFLKPIFTNWLNDKPSNSSMFLSEVSKVGSNQKYSDSLKISRIVDVLIYRNKLVRDMDGIKLDGMVIGLDAANVADNLMNDVGGSEKLATLIDRYENLIKNDKK